MFKVNNKNSQMTLLTYLTFNMFQTFFSVSIVDFEQVNGAWKLAGRFFYEGKFTDRKSYCLKVFLLLLNLKQ